MLAHRRIDSGGIGGQTGNIAALLDGALVVDGAPGDDDREGFQIGPTFGCMQVIELIEGVTAPDFDSASLG